MNARIPCALALFFCPLVNAGTVGLTQGNPVEPAIAGVSVPTDGTWIVLDELMTVGSFYAPLFTYTSPDPLQLDVTDLFVVSDQNEVYLDGVLLGATPPMPDWPALFPPVGPMDDAPFTSDPDVAWARPQFSKQSFAVPAGTHMLTFRNIHIPPTEESVPFADGTVAFRLVPEPSTGLLLLIAAAAVGVCGGRRLPRAMRVARGRAPTLGALTAAMVAALAAPRLAVATPCGPLDVDVVSNVLEVQGTAGVDDLRIRKNGFLIEVYSPASAGTPSCSYDYIATPFGTIRVQTFGDDDTIVVDDSGGALSDTFILELDGGDGADIVLAGIDLNAIPLASAMTMISSLQQASLLVDRALDLLDAPASGCGSASTLVANAAGVVKDAGEDVVMPTAAYVRDIESTLVQPSAQAVRKARDRIAGYLQTFVATDVLAAAAEAEAFAADVEVHVGDFELLLPMGQALLSRAQTLYAHASSMGLETQSGDAITVFQQTVEAHIQTIITLAELCDEDPEPTETEFNEDLQDPSGLPPLCAEVERRIEALEALIDSVEASIDAVEVEGDQFEVDGDALEVAGENLGDDELPTSAAFQIEQDGAAIETTGDGISMTADALNADWEQWVAQKEADLEAAGGTMDARGQAEVLGAANALHAQAAADVEACAAALRAEADLIVADLQALLVFAAPLLRDDLSNFGADPTCPVTANNTVNGGPGADILIGSTGSDLIDGGDGTDLIVGAGGADRLRGGDGNDLIFGGGGNDEIFGGPKVDVLVGNKGNDCIFGGGGQTLTRGSLSVQLGDLFFGLDDNDFLVSGDSTADTLTEIDVAFGNDGDDRIRLSHGGTLTVGSFSLQFGNLAFGGAGDDDILTADGIDVIFGGDDDDTIATAKGAQLTIGTGSSQFRLALGDLIFGGAGADAIDSDDDGADAADQDIDVVFGQDGNDTINGYNGGLLSVGDASNPDFELLLGNLIFGGNQDDEITTLDGIDVIFGGNENDTVTTGKGALLTIGSGSNEFRLALGDLIFGGDGDDTLHGDDPAADRADDDIDVIFGGAGVDTISGYNGGLLSIGDASDPDFEFMLGNVIFGGSEDDEIETLDGVDVIFCGAGNDEAAAGKGYLLNIDDQFKIDLGDLIFGQAGDDTLHGDAPDPPSGDDLDGIDVIFGGPGNDNIYGGTGGNIEVPDQNFCLLFGNLLFGGPDNDLLRGDYLNWDTNDPRGGIDLIFGAGGDDTIEGASGSLIVVGDITTGQAILIGFGNLLFGGPGNDLIKGADEVALCTGVSEDLDDLIDGLGLDDLGGAADLIFCGPGNDEAFGYAGIDFMFGGDGDDEMHGEHGGFIIVPISSVPTPIALGNLMFGADHDDTITSLGRLGLPTVPPIEIDLLFGGPCYDNISAGDGLNLVFGGRADDVVTSGDGINIIFGGKENDNLTAGGIGLNVAFGGRGDDIMTAGDGINVLFGGREADQIATGFGLNLAFGGKDKDVINGGDGICLLFGNAANDTVSGGNGLCLAFGNRGDDDVNGANGLIVLFGNRGNDTVTSGAGLSVNFGNAEHDIVRGGPGLTVLFGNNGEDRVRSGSGLGVAFGNREKDILEFGGGGLYVAFGNNDDDVIVGGGGLNLLFGNRGGDHIFGGGGVNIAFGGQIADYIRGGGSPDLLFGGAGDDQITGAGSRDLLFGNRDNDSLSTDGSGELAFGNRGNDTVRSGGDGSDRDFLFGNRGNDGLFGCNNADKLFGGRGSDSKNRNDCNGLSLPSPACGEVRGVVLIDVDNDNVGDMPHVGVTVFAGSSSAVTDADGRYRIAGLAVGGYSVTQTVPPGYTQISAPPSHAITINGPMGIDLYLNRDFVNRDETCHVNANATGCKGSTLCTTQPSEVQCLPTVVRRVLRCPDTGAICDDASDCPCSDCVPGWAVVECSCVNPNTDCYVSFDAANEPSCSMQCVQGAAVRQCMPINEGDLFRCECPGDPCPTELARFTFSGFVTSGPGVGLPPPWDTVAVGQEWTATYRFIRTAPDQNAAGNFGDYRAIVYHDIQFGAASSSGGLVAASTLIRNRSEPGNADVYSAQFNIPAAGPVLRFTLLLDDGLGTAWTLAGLNPRDGLPLCEHIVLNRFDSRFVMIDTVPPNAAGPIFGTVDSFNCTNCAELLPPAARPNFEPAAKNPQMPAGARPTSVGPLGGAP